MDEADTDDKMEFPTRYLVALIGALGFLPTVGARKCFALVMTHVTSSENDIPSEELLFTNVSASLTEKKKVKLVMRLGEMRVKVGKKMGGKV